MDGTFKFIDSDDGILKKDKGYRIMDYERLKEISDGFVS